VPSLKGTAFDGATLRNLLEMSSGAKWNENYEDRESDFNHLMSCYYDQKPGCVLAYMSRLPREENPGTKFVYNTGVSCLLGLAVINATHKNLATYLSEKIWAPFGMENDAVWVLESKDGPEFGGALVGATLRDYVRFGLFMMKGGGAGGKSVLPAGWIEEATHPQDSQVAYGDLRPGNFMGYGYQWWCWPTGAKAEPNSDGVFQAIGIFGQTIYINSKSHLIVAILSNWPNPGGFNERIPFLEAVAGALQ
jgi:CubicO group peptidase (beta-lactamase class C family)